VFKDGQ
jgi:dynein heavy chain